MTQTERLTILKNRRKVLKNRGKENAKIVNKLNRKIRVLEAK